MNYFEPQMLLGDKLKLQISLAYTAEQKLLFKTLAEYLFKEVTSRLMVGSKIGRLDTVEVSLDVDHVAKLYNFNKEIYSEVGVKRELIKLAEDQGLKAYQYAPRTILITF